MTHHAGVVKPETSAGPIDFGQRRARNLGARLFIQGVALGEANDGRVFPRGAQRALRDHGFGLIRREERQIARLEVALWSVNVSYRRRIGDRRHL